MKAMTDQTPRGASDARIRLLHVDDEPALANVVGTYLERVDDHLEVIPETNASDALARLDDDIDGIVSDYDMPGMNGIEFLESVREDYPDLPFILFTGKGSESVASDAFSVGATDYLQKSQGTDQYTVLANRITNYVEKYRAETERRRRARAMETANEGIAIVDADGRYVEVNDSYADLLETSPEALIGQSWTVSVPAGEVDRLRSTAFPRLAEVGHWTGEVKGQTVDGDTYPQLLSLASLEDGGHVSVIRDYTERKEREQALSRASVRMERALDITGAVVWEWDIETDTITTHPSPHPLLGTEITTLSEFIEHVHPDDAPVVRDALETAVETDTSYDVEFRVCRDGELRVIEDYGEVLTGTNGEPVGITGVGIDVTEARQRERTLEELHEIATELTTFETREAVCHRTVEAAETVLKFDHCAITLEENGILEVAAISEGLPAEGVTAMSVDEGIGGKTYRTGQPFLINDVRSHRHAKPQGPYESALSVPIGSEGVFQTVAEERAAFTCGDLKLAQLLICHAETALRRLDTR